MCVVSLWTKKNDTQETTNETRQRDAAHTKTHKNAGGAFFSFAARLSTLRRIGRRLGLGSGGGALRTFLGLRCRARRRGLFGRVTGCFPFAARGRRRRRRRRGGGCCCRLRFFC